jgi:hypothetical protein
MVRVDSVPVAYQAHQSYPNPFNPLCTIRYDISRAGMVSLRVFDVTGASIRTLFNGWREPGEYTELPSDVYFYRLEVGNFVATRKMVLLR